jgi:hypothetical protein
VRVKAVDAKMPVLMIHVPAVADQELFATVVRMSAYFAKATGFHIGRTVRPVPHWNFNDRARRRAQE